METRGPGGRGYHRFFQLCCSRVQEGTSNAGVMQLRMVLGLLGQLIAIPAALFFVPTTYPKLFSTAGTADSTSAVVEDDGVIMTSADAISAQER